MAFPFGSQREATFKDGCLSVRKNVLDNIRSRSAPGPIYSPKPRVSSRERSLRDITFGTSPARYNDSVEKPSRRSPGPQSYDPDAIRRAPQSTHRKVAGVSFGTGKRACNKMDTASCKMPSPAEYDPENIRRGLMFSKKGTSSIKFGTAQYKNRKPVDLPGPQSYDPIAIKRGIMFTKSTMSSVKFGSPPKNDLSKRKQENSKSPGPQSYDTERIRRGIYSLSTKKKPVGVKFTTGPRTYNDMEERERASKPGPNKYEVPSALGKQINSRYKSQPSISFGAR
mmetsp:Transcript_32926/g.47664  ORF Transcript_32926/g.47664 Transcript_32926/m.47664 type:complete len:282 (+) Transcript_32926:2263-3108(+)